MNPRISPPQPEVPPESISDEERLWGTFAHLSGLLGYVFPLGNVIAPAAIWLWQREKSFFVSDQAKEALNFQITVSIAMAASLILMYVLIGFLLVGVVGLYALVVMIIGATKANKGKFHRYPLSFRLVSSSGT